MLSIQVGGEWLSAIGAYSNVTVEFGLHGSEAASWEMLPDLRHPLLRANTSVAVYDGGIRIWVGTMLEPGSDGKYAARGIWHQAERTPTLTTAGALTTIPNTAIADAYTRGEISWTYASSISTTAWSDANGELNLAQLLDGVAAEAGLRWSVTSDYLISMAADPTTPTWLVPHAVAGRGLAPAEDDFATHLVGSYFSAAGVEAAETVGSTAAATVFGRRTVVVDLFPMGVITAARANAVLTGMFLQSGARMGWAEGLDLDYGQITTPGGVPATLAQVRAGQMIRLAGTVDTSRPNAMPAYTDIVIESSTYTESSNTVSLKPLGYAPRNLRDVLDAALEDA